jgi:hypothetical protein
LFTADVLQQLNPSYFHKPTVDPEHWVDPDPKEQLNNARHLAKYVFPRQHGLSNPFSQPINDHNAVYDHARELEIKVFKLFEFTVFRDFISNE